ncbi:MAG: Mpo1-like protein [Pyrinomonadaceae bacterium]
MSTNPQNYTEFWDFYASEHSLPLTRLLHFVGTTLGIVLLIFFVARGQWYFFPVFFLCAYGFAWYSHFFIEKNRPASFRYPFWSFISDFKMIWYMLTGRMSAEVARVTNGEAVRSSGREIENV